MNLLVMTSDQKIKSHLNSIGIPENWSCNFIDSKIDELEIMVEVHNHKPFLVILDYELYTTRSYSILKSIKDIVKNVSIIFITNDDSIEIGRQISSLGIHKYLIKPLNYEHLTESILCLKKFTSKSNFH